ncbi:MAG TPA: LPS-assembly protein LptD [Desulfobacterales bacterium]|nr:LPS-assembly protein LptD [Desulfobacterales bacterium]
MMVVYMKPGFFAKTGSGYHIVIFPIFIIILSLISADALAGSDKSLFRDDQDAPWHIVADTIEYDPETKQYVAKGNVTITKDDRKLSADFVRFDHSTMEVLAEGNMVMTAGEDILTGSRVEMDMKTETGTIYDAGIFLKENHFYIKGDKIQKVGKDTYTAHKASISACDGDTPAWKITGRNLKVTIEGYAFVTHAALWAKKTPVFYTPFFVFPVKQKRQSGLLLPQTGYSDRKGAEYNQPFYWAINESSDATFYLHYMEKRGAKMGLEYRYVLDRLSKGTLMCDFLEDRNPSEPETRNTDRYWFRMKHDQALPAGVSAKLDIDISGDQDYLDEFREGYTGFDKTEAFFSKNFGRELDDYNDLLRVSSLSLGKTWHNYSLNTGVRWYDDVRENDTDTTLHKLPFIRFDSLKQQVHGTPLYWKLDSGYTYFYREDGTKGHRTDIYPRFSLPWRFKNYVMSDLSLGLRETLWHIKKEDAEETTLSRHLYDIKLDISSNLSKVFPLGVKLSGFMEKFGFSPGITRIESMIKPEIVYEYIPDQQQEKYPEFDSLGRIEKKNRITCSVTNIFSAKSENSGYRPFCRFKLAQSYDISETDPSMRTNPLGKQHFLPIYGEIEMNPGPFLSLYADAEWSHYENEFKSCNVALNLSDQRGDRIFVSHRRTQDLTESVYADINIKVSDKFSAYADYERNLYDGKEIKNSLGFLYTAQCWSMDFHHTNEAGDHRYAFMINLYGLGGLGSR